MALRLVRRSLLAVMVMIVSLTAGQSAFAYTYYPPGPQGTVGVGRPVLSQQLLLDAGDEISGAAMSIDGVKVQPSWNHSGLVRYTPPTPLAQGLHRIKLSVEVAAGKSGHVYAPLVSEFTITVAADAVANIAASDAEEQRAVAWVNRYRKAAGLPVAAQVDGLTAAARAHARYLAANPAQRTADPHGERPGKSGFTGATGGERVRYFGFDASTGEVINFTDRAEPAVDGWLATLYHRVPLVHPGLQGLGYGLASSGGSPINVMQAALLPDLAGVSPWPYPGQTGVPTEWSGAETPDPFRLFPGVGGPVGYTVSLTWGGDVKSLTLTSADLRGPDGLVDVLRYSPATDKDLTDTVAVIPVGPLGPGTAYQARFAGTVDLGAGPVPFQKSWSFTTAGRRPPTVTRWTVRAVGDAVSRISLTGTGFAPDMQVFLGGLPVADLQVESDTAASFRPPAGALAAPLTLLVRGGEQEDLVTDVAASLSGLTLPADAGAFTAVPLQVGGKAMAAPALIHRSGALLVPEEALTALGGQKTAVAAIGRAYWSFGDHTGDYTVGYTSATVQEQSLPLAVPAQVRDGKTYVDATFLARLSGLPVVRGAAGVTVGAAVDGLYDIATHWAREAVTRLVRAGIIAGQGDGTFKPEGTLTRAAFAKLMVGARSLATAPGSAGMPDTAGHWVATQGYLSAAVTAGIVVPADYPDGHFEPDQAISREEIAVMVERALGREAEAKSRKVLVQGGTAYVGGKYFADAGSWAHPGYVADAVERGIIAGYQQDDGTYAFRPTRPATRAEAAVITTRMMDAK